MDHEQQRAQQPTETKVAAESYQPDAQDLLGNAALQERMGLGAQAEGGEPATEAAVSRSLGNVVRAMDAVMSQRMESLRRLEEDTVPQEVDNPRLDTLIALSTIALGAATAGFGGFIGAAVTASVGNALLKEFMKSALKDLVDERLNTLVGGALQRQVASWSEGGTVDPRKAFFRGQADAISDAMGPIGVGLLGSASVENATAIPDAAAVIAMLATAMNTHKGAARDEQRKSSLVAWMNLLAQADLGTTDGTDVDLENADDRDKGLLDRLFGTEARGVVRITVRGDDSDEPLSILAVKVSGLNADLAEELSKMAVSLDDLGLPVYLEGKVFAHLPDFQGDIALGWSGSSPVVHGSSTGRGWLQHYGMGKKTPGLEPGDQVEVIGGDSLTAAGAERVRNDIADQKLMALTDPATQRKVPVEHG